MRRKWSEVGGRVWALGLLILLVCCVSQTVHEQRFAQSLELAPPTVSVTLADPAHFTFAAVGDLHIGNQETSRFQRILAAAQAEGDAFVAVLGDIVDSGEGTDYRAFESALAAQGFTGKALPIIGNHDVFFNGWDQWKIVFGAATYSVTLGNTKFIALDTADGALGDRQRAWLEGQMNKGDSTNLILLSHYMPVVPDIQTYLKLSNDEEAFDLMKLATSRGVGAWLGGHYHSYVQKRISGVEYLVAGGGGGRRMGPVRDYFFTQVRVDGDRITFERRTVE